MQKKKILYVVEAFGGGLFTYIVDLVNELSNQYDFTIAYAIRSQTPENFKEYFDPSIEFIEIKNFTRGVNLIRDLSAVIELGKVAKEVKPDIIHLHSSKAGVLGRMAFWFSNSALFYTPHGYSFLMQDMSRIKRMIYYIAEKTAGMSKCMTISCSEGEHAESQKLTKKVTYVNNGINIKEIDKQLKGINSSGSIDDSSYVFTIGRICYQKNPTLFNQIALKMPDKRFLWIGDGELRDELTAPNIEVTGWLERIEALKYASKASIFILPSRWEGLSMSLLEAMYMKKPCVVSDIIGNHDVIESNRNGVICNNIDEYVAAIIKLSSDKEFKECCCKCAYEDILREYNTTVMAKKYAEIYESCVV